MTGSLNVSRTAATTGWIVLSGNGAVSWSSRRQGTVSPSSCEAEYKAATEAIQEVVWLRNLLLELKDDKLRDEFSRFGQVMVMRDRDTGRSRGFGFVTLVSSEEAYAVLKDLNGNEIDGRKINVSLVNARPGAAVGGAQANAGGSYGGGSYGGGGYGVGAYGGGGY